MPADLAALLLGALLGWAGLRKLADRSTPEPGPGNAALMRLLHDTRRVALALRTLGAVEVAAAAALLLRPMWTAAGAAAAALGAGFVGYLAWARAVAPGQSCGCTGARHAPVTARSFTRAGLVAAGGLAATAADRPWWTVLRERPVAAGAVLLAAAAALVALSGDLDELWLLPLRRARLRLLGSPLAGATATDGTGSTGGTGGTGGAAPVAASVELLEQSLAWQTTAAIVRSALLEHWDLDGWRFLRFAGVAGDRPVTVVFAVAADATAEAAEPAVRVTVVDPDRQEVLPVPAPA